MIDLDLKPVFLTVENLRLTKQNWNHSGLEILFKIRLLKLDNEQAVLKEYGTINEYYKALHNAFESFFVDTCPVLSNKENKFLAGYYTQNIANNFDYERRFESILSAMHNLSFEVFNRFQTSLAMNEQKTVNFMLKIVDKPETLESLNVKLVSSQFLNELNQMDSVLRSETSKLERILNKN